MARPSNQQNEGSKANSNRKINLGRIAISQQKLQNTHLTSPLLLGLGIIWCNFEGDHRKLYFRD